MKRILLIAGSAFALNGAIAVNGLSQARSPLRSEKNEPK